MNKIVLVSFIIIMTILGSFGGFFLKKSTASSSMYSILKSKFLYVGIFFYLLGAVINIYVLKFMPYSVVLPMTAITYVWSMILSKLILKEKVTYIKLIGLACIILGAFFIGS